MIYLLLAIGLGFVSTLIGVPFARKYLAASGIIAIDQQKPDKPRLVTSGGVVVMFGFLVSVTSFLGFNSLFGTVSIDTAAVLAALNSAIIIALIGLIDDIHIDLGKVLEEDFQIQKDGFTLDLHQEIEVPGRLDKFTGNFFEKNDGDQIRNGLGQIPKMLFVLPAALPLIAVGAGSWTMHFPLVGTISWGLIYPFVLLPVGLFFVSNVVNMLAGTNGLSTSLSLVTSTTLGLYAYTNGRFEAALIAFGFSSCLLAFLYYNKYPALILPGDSLTYLSGAAMFSTMVIGDMEKFAVVIFSLYFVEFFLKLRSGFTASSWGLLQEDGSLRPQHEKIYSLTHPLMRKGLRENQITWTLTAVQTLICVTALVLFNGWII